MGTRPDFVGESGSVGSAALTSMASNVGIAEDVRFKFQIIQPVLNHVAHADNASQLAIAKHRHMAHAMAGHQAHQVGEIIARDAVIKPCVMMSFTCMDATGSPY